MSIFDRLNIRGLLQDEEFLFGAGLLSAGSMGQSIGQAVFPAMLQAAQVKKSFQPTAKKTKQAFDTLTGKNVFVTDLEVAQSPGRFTPIDKSQNISVSPDGTINIGTISGQKLIEKNTITDQRTARNLKGNYKFLADFIPKMQEQATKTPSGAVGSTLAFLDVATSQFDQLGRFTGFKKAKISFGTDTDKFLESKGFKRNAANYSKLKGSVTKLGYTLAKIEEPDNPRLSEGDVLRQLDRVNFSGSQNQFINSLQGILEDEYIASKAKYETLDPKGNFGFEAPNFKKEKEEEEDQIVDDPLGLLR
tara:strand:- start:266 stop:1180 length:915 start_codon:yes stop_codon:yes gene_type:complete